MSEVPANNTLNPVTYPGKTMGIVGLILAIFFSIIGLIVSIVARSKSKKAGYKNTPATVGIVIGIITTIGLIIAIVGGTIAGIAAANLLNENCSGVASGEQVDAGSGVTITCP